MFNFFCAIFFGIGFTISIIALGYGVSNLIEKINKAAKERTDRIQRLINALERIEANTRKTPQA